MTTGLWAAAGDPSRRMALVSRWDGADKPDFASVNLNEPGAAELAALLASLGIAVEAGIASADEADRLAASGFGDQVLRILIEPEDSDPQAAAASGNTELVRAAAQMAAKMPRSVGLTGGEAVVLRRWPSQQLGPAQPVPARPRRLEA